MFSNGAGPDVVDVKQSLIGHKDARNLAKFRGSFALPDWLRSADLINIRGSGARL